MGQPQQGNDQGNGEDSQWQPGETTPGRRPRENSALLKCQRPKPPSAGFTSDWPRGAKQGLAWGWSLLIVLLCLSPNSPSPPSGLPWDKLVHLLLFGGFAWLWQWTYPRGRVKVAIAGMALGLAIEILQSALDWGRMGDGWDFLADCLGLFLGLGLPAQLQTQLRRLMSPRQS
jgi:hypothetical protein